MRLKMEKVEYCGDLWEFEKPHPELLALLTSQDVLIEIAHGEPPYHVMLGVPHQAAVGIGLIAENRIVNGTRCPRDSDENAALFALVAFATLRKHNVPCKLVIAAHATDHDPNKVIQSPYCKSILALDTRLLLECHGAGESRRHELEVTAGRNARADALHFGRMLLQRLGFRYRLAAQRSVGSDCAVVFGTDGTEAPGRLTLPALETDSLIEAGRLGIGALHLEAKPVFRIPCDKSNTLTEAGEHLGRAVAETIVAYLGSGFPRLNG